MRYKISYWLNGNTYIKEIQTKDKAEAKLLFLLSVPSDDIISIEEVKE